MKYFILLIVSIFSIITSGQEICTNGIDDDGDGKIDLNDSDCQCNEVVNSIIPNPSFEELDFCPYDYSQLTAAKNWEQATEATTDYMNTCGWLMSSSFQSSGLIPPPDGNGFVGTWYMGNYKEYLGTNLLSPMVANTDYQLNLNAAGITLTGDRILINGGVYKFSPTDVVVYGNTNSVSFPISTNRGCPLSVPGWKIIGSASYSPKNKWEELSIKLSPTENISAIMIGAPCELPSDYISTGPQMDNGAPMLFFDNLILNKTSEFGITIENSGSYCEQDLVLKADVTVSVTNPQYQWYKNGVAITGATQPTYTVPTSTTVGDQYKVKIFNNIAGCYVSSNFTISNLLDAPEVTVENIKCGVLGSITVDTPADSYSFDGGKTWQASNTKTNLSAGSYSIMIKKNSCISSTKTVSVVVEATTPNAPNVRVIQPTCTESKGSIVVNTTAAAYSYDNGTTWTTQAIASNKTAGTYIVKIKNAGGCVSPGTSVVINAAPTIPAAPTFTQTNPNCSNQSTGSITITSTAAQYSFDNGATWSSSATKSSLVPGTYSIKVKNTNGCESVATSVTINTAPPDPLAPAFTKTDPTCTILTGSITITSVASQYSFDNGMTWQTANTKSGLASGNYQIKVKNANGCESPATSVTIAASVNISNAPSFTKIDPTCTISTGSVTITSTASQYSFDNGATWQTSNTKSSLASGVYQIKIKNTSGCESPSATVTIPVAPTIPAAPTFTQTNPDCTNPATGSITITSTAAQYSFDNGATWSSSATKSGLAPGTHFIKVKNSAGCESAATQVTIGNAIAVPTTPTYTKVDPHCNVSKGSITITSTAIAYSFDNGTTWTTNPTITDLDEGDYIIKTKNEYGCESPAVTVTIKTIYFDLNVEQSCFQNPVIEPVGGKAPYQYSIDGVNYQSSPVFLNLTNGGYYTIYVKDANDCVVETQQYYFNSYKVASAFSPNNDGINDTWSLPILQTCPTAQLYIYDRYGRKLYQMSSANYDWDGTVKGKPVPSDTYWFAIDFNDGKTPVYKSHITIKRSVK